MQVYDVVMLLVIAAATAYGAWKGLAWQVASLASLVLSYFVARQFGQQLAARIEADPPWNVGVAMLALFLGTSLAVWIAFRLVSGAIDRLKLKEFDRQIGAMVGFVKGALLCIVITIFAVSLLGPVNREKVVNSKSGHYIALALDRAHAVMPKEVHDALHPYLHKLDDRLSPAERMFGHFHEDEPNFDVNLGIEFPRDMRFPVQGDELLEAGQDAFDRFRSATEKGTLHVLPH
jgi:membrane protein required for colicin V production